MSSGILRSWYLTKLKKARHPLEYIIALNDVFMYEWQVFKYNTKAVFTVQIDK